MRNLGNITKTMAAGGLALLLLPLPNPLPRAALRLDAQDFPSRLRRPPSMPPRITPPAPQASPPQAPAAPQTAAPEAQQPAAQSQAPPQALPPSLLQQPAKPSKIEFTADTLSIAAENSSLNEILHAISSKSGMLIQGLAGDERVFGNFGPGKPRDVLADLLNGTPYNIVMVGDLSSGAPRQLILSPLSSAAASTGAAAASPQPAAEDDSDNTESDPKPDIPGPLSSVPREKIPPGFNPQAVKTPQQLFQELQAMRQQQQQQQQQQQEENAR